MEQSPKCERKTLKILEENIGEYDYDIRAEKAFLKSNKVNIFKLNYMKLQLPFDKKTP